MDEYGGRRGRIGIEDTGDTWPMRKIIAAAVVLAIIGIGAWLAFGRPPVEAVSAGDPDVTIECSASTGVTSSECGTWGDEILAFPAPSTTFEMDDLARLRIDRPLLGFGSPCQVEYFIERYPDDSAWDSDVPCR
jgi:hypothetical protein